MRLFIAVGISKEVHDYLLSLQKIFPDVGKFTFPKHFHLTLKFLGDVHESKLDEIKNKLSQINFQPFELELTDVDCFPSFSRINVVWIGVSPSEPLINLQKQINSVLGLKNEKDLIPHLTLARVKYLKEKKVFKTFLKSLSIKKLNFKADNFKLYSSILTPEGPEYKVEAVFP